MPARFICWIYAGSPTCDLSFPIASGPGECGFYLRNPLPKEVIRKHDHDVIRMRNAATVGGP